MSYPAELHVDFSLRQFFLRFRSWYQVRPYLFVGHGRLLTLTQPAIDAFALDMMRRFNKLAPTRSTSWFRWGKAANAAPLECPQPLIYNTFQGYLRR